MIKVITQTVVLTLLIAFSTFAQAEKSLGYEKLATVQPTQDLSKVEVIEFFWYGCPHCYRLEPVLDKWLKTKPENVTFIRQPAAFNPVWAAHAKAYFTAKVLGVADKLHADFFDAIQVEKQKLRSEEQLAEFFTAHGISKIDFHNAYNSFPVDTQMRKAKAMPQLYGITGVPAIIINGKYKTSGPIAGSHENMIKVLNTLIKQESKK